MRLILFLLAFLLSTPAYAMTGHVYRIVDGDTLKLSPSPAVPPVTIRIWAIDAPEHDQAFGAQAKDDLATLVLNRDVEVIEHGTDRYGRTVGEVVLNGADVGGVMIEAGAAWAYHGPAHVRTPVEYDAMEREAREAHRGLWAAPAVAPWVWRQKEKR